MEISDFIGIFVLMFYFLFMYWNHHRGVKARQVQAAASQTTVDGNKVNNASEAYLKNKSKRLKNSSKTHLSIPPTTRQKTSVENAIVEIPKHAKIDLQMDNLQTQKIPLEHVKTSNVNQSRAQTMLKRLSLLSDLVIYKEIIGKPKSLRSDE